jgi:hypothetical protein
MLHSMLFYSNEGMNSFIPFLALSGFKRLIVVMYTDDIGVNWANGENPFRKR